MSRVWEIRKLPAPSNVKTLSPDKIFVEADDVHEAFRAARYIVRDEQIYVVDVGEEPPREEKKGRAFDDDVPDLD